MTTHGLAAGSPSQAAAAASSANRLLVAFSVAFVVFMILPSFLSAPLALFPLMKVEDAFTLLTPVVLIPLYWLLLKQAAGDRITGGAMLLFLILAVLWVDGHGIKLAANSIGRLFNEEGTDPLAQLTYFYDETLGHYYWHIGLVALSVLLVTLELRNPSVSPVGSLWGLGIAAVLYGLAFFMIVVEGQTGPLGVPFAAVFSVTSVLWARNRFGSKPILTFFFIGYVTALVLFAVWGIYWRGLPEFSEVGII